MSKADTEIAPYKLLLQQGKFDVRSYDSMILAEVTQNSTRENNSFRKLFGFITGDNDTRQEIAMTAPVFSSYSEQGMQMAFVMPETMTLADTPAPEDPSIQVRATTPQLYAVVRFNGRMNTQSIDKQTRELLDWIKAHKLEIVGGLVTAGYNSPYTPPAFRRNEVLIPIADWTPVQAE